MKKQPYLLFILIVLVLHSLVSGTVTGGDKFFPRLDGFSIQGEIVSFTPETLFEYINGGADLYLNFEFEKLYSSVYKQGEDKEITVDIYFHKDISNGFGIYSHERPLKGDFLKIGSEGYYEEGSLNFYKGKAYVKISAFGLNDKDETILKKLSENIAFGLDSFGDSPSEFSLFPITSSLAHTDKYININFMGHSFLNKVYSRDYSIKGKTVKMFIIKNSPLNNVKDILKKYIDFAKNKNQNIEKIGDTYRFSDPYYKNEGKMNIRISDNLLIGMLSDDYKLFKKLSSFPLDMFSKEKK